MAAVALGYFAYNFIKVHRTLRVTPATAAGVTDRLCGKPASGGRKDKRRRSVRY